MLGVIDKYVGKYTDKPVDDPHLLLLELSNTSSDNKRSVYVGMLKNILELLKVSNKGYSIVFMNQLLTDIQRCDNYQTLPISKGENLLLTNVVNELGYRFNSDETLQKVVKAQSYIRRFLYHKRYITHKTFSASKFQQYNSTFLNLHEKQIHYIENIETLLYYFDELRAQPNFQFLNEYPYKEYYESIRCILDVEKVFKRGLDDINGTFPKVAGVGQVVSKYCENALSAYRELSLQGAVVMALVCYERKNSQFKEAHELLSKGQTYPFRYLLQSFPRLTHIDDIINAIESMNKAVETLEEYKEETVPLKKCYDEITTLKKDITNPLVTESTTSETSSTTNQINPEFNDFLLKIKKEFSKTPSVVEVYMKLGMDVGDIEQKRLLKESRVTVEVHPNIDQFPPNLKANLQSVSVTSLTTGKTEKKSTTSLRPRLQKRTDRQKAEAKLKAAGELKKEIEILKNSDLKPLKFDATMFIMNDVIYLAKMDGRDKYHVLSEIPLTGNGFSVSNSIDDHFDINSKVFDFKTSILEVNASAARTLFLLLREIYYVYTPPKIFGAPLEDILEREGNDTGVPLCIRSLGEYLMDEKNIQTEGVFRKNGSVNKISGLAHILDQMPDHFNSFEAYSVHDITSTFKKFFMEMPVPLFSPEIVELFIDIPKDSPNEKDEIKRIINEKMNINFVKLAKFLVNVLKKTSDNESVTLMNAHALSVCIGPAVIRSTSDVNPNSSSKKVDDVLDTVGKITRGNEVFEELIKDTEFFFS